MISPCRSEKVRRSHCLGLLGVTCNLAEIYLQIFVLFGAYHVFLISYEMLTAGEFFSVLRISCIVVLVHDVAEAKGINIFQSQFNRI